MVAGGPVAGKICGEQRKQTELAVTDAGPLDQPVSAGHRCALWPFEVNQAASLEMVLEELIEQRFENPNFKWGIDEDDVPEVRAC